MEQHQAAGEINGHLAPSKPHVMHSGSPHIRAMDQWDSPHLSAIPEPVETRARRKSNISMTSNTARTLLRVDAFLGEWLSPDYFDNITPPPSSKMMVAGAKADLLRRGDPVDTVRSSSSAAAKEGNFPGGWVSNPSISNGRSKKFHEIPLANMSTLAHDLPRLDRANSHASGSLGRVRSNQRLASRIESGSNEDAVRYVPPVPSYAISPSQPIPQGYVAHARDACVKVDYQWDSSRPPLEWGSGGEYGEEWSSMHKRFRRGLHEMISFYLNGGGLQRPGNLSDGSAGSQQFESQLLEDSDDEETDTILVLVTHGAGCNALIGALTNQPVLIDVGMASLTMAVRKNVDYKRLPQKDASDTSPSRRRLSSKDPGISDDYDVEIVASTDHLRAGSQFLPSAQRSRSPSLPVRDKSPYRYERHGTATGMATHVPISHLHESFRTGYEAKFSDGGFGGIKRSATAASVSTGGLWSKPTPQKSGEAAQQEAKPKDPVPQHEVGPSINKDAFNGRSERMNIQRETDEEIIVPTSANDGRTFAHSGLWGAPPQALSAERDKGAKRRWTLSQAR